jgi:hypothetical protein
MERAGKPPASRRAKWQSIRPPAHGGAKISKKPPMRLEHALFR